MIEDPTTTSRALSGVSESLIIPLYIRALETQSADPILKDERAVELVEKLEIDPSILDRAQVRDEVRISLLLRNRQFDLITRNYLTNQPDSVVVHLGCGLDARFERVDNGQFEWYDLDLPEVINLRGELLSNQSERYHLLACSVLEHSWMKIVRAHLPRPFLFLAEGLFMFFEEQQIRELILALRGEFTGSELVFDAFSPFFVRANNLRVKRTHIGAEANWGLKRASEVEDWGKGIRLLDEWYTFKCPDPRLAHLRWVRMIPSLAKATGIFTYQLNRG